jgi:predicted nucleotidyltransferase
MEEVWQVGSRPAAGWCSARRRPCTSIDGPESSKLRYGQETDVLRDQHRKEIRTRLEAAFRDRLRGVLLYGSEARNEAREGSDLDLMVLLNGPVRLGRDLETIVEALYPVQLEIDAPIHATTQASVRCRRAEALGHAAVPSGLGGFRGRDLGDGWRHPEPGTEVPGYVPSSLRDEFSG